MTDRIPDRWVVCDSRGPLPGVRCERRRGHRGPCSGSPPGQPFCNIAWQADGCDKIRALARRDGTDTAADLAPYTALSPDTWDEDDPGREAPSWEDQ